MPVFIFHFSGAEYCSFISVLRNKSSKQIPEEVYWPEGAKWEKHEHQSVAAHTFTFIVQQSQRSLPSNIYCVKKHHLCSEPANRRTSVIIPTVPLYCDGNGTLNQCLAPSGFITRWQPIVAAVMTTSGSGRGAGESEADGSERWQWCHFTAYPPPVAWRRLLSGAFDACWVECNGWTYLLLTVSISLLIEMSRHPQRRALKTNFVRHCSTFLFKEKVPWNIKMNVGLERSWRLI